MKKSGNHSTAETVLRCLAKNSSADLSDKSKPLKDLGLDSLDLIETLFELEQLANKTLSGSELESLSTIADLVRVFDSPSDHSKET